MEGFTGDGMSCDGIYISHVIVFKHGLCNFLLIDIPVVCENCSPNAMCSDGRCVCREGYTGEGMTCEEFKDGKFLSFVICTLYLLLF